MTAVGIGLAIRCISTHARQIAISDDSAALVRGVDAYKHFIEERCSTLDRDLIGAELQRKAADAQRWVLYAGTNRKDYRKGLWADPIAIEGSRR